MAKKTTSQADKSVKAVAQKKKTEEDLFVEVGNAPEKVDETTSESYCPFDLVDDGEIKEAIYGSFTEKELQEVNMKAAEG